MVASSAPVGFDIRSSIDRHLAAFATTVAICTKLASLGSLQSS
jgi:hypothetical protein